MDSERAAIVGRRSHWTETVLTEQHRQRNDSESPVDRWRNDRRDCRSSHRRFMGEDLGDAEDRSTTRPGYSTYRNSLLLRSSRQRIRQTVPPM